MCVTTCLMLHDALALLNCIHIADFYTFQGLQGDYQCYAVPYILSVRGSWLGSSSMVFPMLVSSLADRHTSPVLWCTLVSGIQGPEDRSLCSWEPKLASVAVYNTSLLLALFPLGEEAKPVHHVRGWKCHSSTHRSVCWPKKIIMERKIQEHPGRSLNISPLRTKSSGVQFLFYYQGALVTQTAHARPPLPHMYRTRASSVVIIVL